MRGHHALPHAEGSSPAAEWGRWGDSGRRKGDAGRILYISVSRGPFSPRLFSPCSLRPGWRLLPGACGGPRGARWRRPSRGQSSLPAAEWMRCDEGASGVGGQDNVFPPTIDPRTLSASSVDPPASKAILSARTFPAFAAAITAPSGAGAWLQAGEWTCGGRPTAGPPPLAAEGAVVGVGAGDPSLASKPPAPPALAASAAATRGSARSSAAASSWPFSSAQSTDIFPAFSRKLGE